MSWLRRIWNGAMMDEPTFDVDGYPRDATLDAITNWMFCSERGLRELMAFVREAWSSLYGRVTVEGNLYTLVTGGWSGNESIVSALQNNRMFWGICWQLSQVGGLYEFKLPGDTDQKQPIEIRLVLLDWHKNWLPICVDKPIGLTSGTIHSGTYFNGTMVLTSKQGTELREAMKQGYQPAFWVEVKERNN